MVLSTSFWEESTPIKIFESVLTTKDSKHLVSSFLELKAEKLWMFKYVEFSLEINVSVYVCGGGACNCECV